MRLTREERREQTRERLFEAARESVARAGYDGTSIGAIAEAAGFTKGAFFSNFDSKEALLLELLRRHKAEEVEAIGKILRDTQEHEGEMLALNRYFDGLDGQQSHWALLDVELQLQASRSPEFALRYQEVQGRCRAALGGLIARFFTRGGHIPPAAPEVLAGLFMALVNGLALAALANPERPPIKQQMRLVLDGLMAVAAPANPAEG